MVAEPEPAAAAPADPRRQRSKSRPVRPGRMPLSEFAFGLAGAGSPFGDDITFPVPPEQLLYEHPSTGLAEAERGEEPHS